MDFSSRFSVYLEHVCTPNKGLSVLYIRLFSPSLFPVPIFLLSFAKLNIGFIAIHFFSLHTFRSDQEHGQQQQKQHFGTQHQFGSTGAVLCEIKDLYLMMGKEFETLDEVPAGNMIGKEISKLKQAVVIITLSFW